VCLPVGRDQPDNAARVAWRGAGLGLSPRSSPAVIGAAVQHVLHDQRFAAAARRLGSAFSRDAAAERAARALEAVADEAVADQLEGR
jgi:UDP:flavonoid glycosyltransferase YjiC (YdhE family)